MNALFLVLLTIGILAAVAMLPAGLCGYEPPYTVRWASVFAKQMLTWAAFWLLGALLVVIAGLFFLLVLTCGLLGLVGYGLFTALVKIPDYKYPSK